MTDTKKKHGSLKPKSQGKTEKQSKEEHPDEHIETADENAIDNVTNEDIDEPMDNFVDEPDDIEDDEPSGIVLEGRVKWFNDRRGFGYITCISAGDHNGADIFVHHTNVRPQESKYRSLYTNEYVQFHLGEADAAYDENDNPMNSSYQHQATHVTGIGGGPLLCDGSYRPSNNQKREHNFRGGSNRTGRRDEDDEESSHTRQPRMMRNNGNGNGYNNSNSNSNSNGNGNGNYRRTNERPVMSKR